jgi:acid stress-induced BolA-like protein IbaG/YrbA
MSIDELHALLEREFLNAYIDVKHSGNHYSITVVDDVFVGKKPVQRQQLVYSVLQEEITSGSIHAVQIKTYSKQEWQQYISDMG